MQEWPVYGGDAGRHQVLAADRYRSRATWRGLAPAWEWRPEEGPLEAFGTRPGNFQNTPLMIENVLYVSTPYNRVVALDAETGAREVARSIPRPTKTASRPTAPASCIAG